MVSDSHNSPILHSKRSCNVTRPASSALTAGTCFEPLPPISNGTTSDLFALLPSYTNSRLLDSSSKCFIYITRGYAFAFAYHQNIDLLYFLTQLRDILGYNPSINRTSLSPSVPNCIINSESQLAHCLTTGDFV